MSSCFRGICLCLLLPGVSGAVLLSIPWNCVLIKTLLFFGLFLRSLSTQLFFLVASLFLVLGGTGLLLWGLLLGNFAEVFFHLSDGVRFSTCVRLLPVRVFPFFLFLYVVFLILLGTFSWVFLYCAFLLSGSDLSSTPCIGLLCLLRMHTINSCVGDT